MSGGQNIIQTQTVADSLDGWSKPLGFDQFNPSFGTLNGVDVGLIGDITGNAAIENLGTSAANVSIDLAGNVTVTAPDGTVLAGVNPEAAKTIVLGAYDGTTDFAGASGTVVSGFSNTASTVAQFVPGGTIGAPFVGTGTIDLTASSQANSILNSGGNLLSLTTGQAGATVSVDYNYSPASNGSEFRVRKRHHQQQQSPARPTHCQRPNHGSPNASGR